jgi:hypothetical protein
MIFILSYWAYITIVFVLLGSLLQRVVNFIVYRKTSLVFISELTIVNGITCLLLITSVAHFFLPVNGYLHIAIVILAFSSFIINFKAYKAQIEILHRSLKKMPLLFKIALALFIVFFAYVATDLPLYNLDEGRYHFQTLLWTKTYKIVPGLANLHDRFASNSAWYLLNAFFDVGFFSRKVFHIINPLILLYLFIYGFVSAYRLFVRYSLVSMLAVLVVMYLISNFSFWRYWYMIGITPDMGVQFFIIAFFIHLAWMYSSYGNRKLDIRLHAVFSLLICLMAYSCRATGFILLSGYTVVLAMLWYRKQLRTMLLSQFCITAVVLVIVLARNTILSGHPLFPSTALDIVNIPWKFPDSYTYYVANFPVNHVLFQYIGHRIDFTGLFDVRRLKLIAAMFYNQNIVAYGNYSVMFFAIVLLFVSMYVTRKKKYIVFGSIISLVFLLSLIFTGLVYRFGAGYVCMGISLPVSLFIHYNAKNIFKPLSWLKYVTVVIVCAGAMYVFVASTPISLRRATYKYPVLVIKEIGSNVFTLPPVPVTPTSKVVVNGVTINVSQYIAPVEQPRLPTWYSYKNDSCKNGLFIQYSGYTTGEEYNTMVATMNWMNDLPCVGAIYIGMAPRTNNIADGFEMKSIAPMNNSNTTQAQNKIR